MLYVMLLFLESVRVLRELDPPFWESFRKEPDWMVTLTLFIFFPSVDPRSLSLLPLTDKQLGSGKPACWGLGGHPVWMGTLKTYEPS